MKLSLFSLIAATLAPSAIASGLPRKGLLPPPFPAEGATPAQRERYAQDANYHQVHEVGPHALSPVHPGANPARGHYQHPPVPYFPSSQHHPPQDQYRGGQPPALYFQPHHQDRHPFNQGSQPPVHYQHQGLQHGTPHFQLQHRQDPHREPFNQPPVPPRRHPPPEHQSPLSRLFVPKIPDSRPDQVPFGREHAHDVVGDALGINLQAIDHSERKIQEPGKTPKARQIWESTKDRHVGQGDWLSRMHKSLEPDSEARRKKVSFVEDMTKALRFKHDALKTLGEE